MYRDSIEAMIGQTPFKFLLQRNVNGAIEEERDEELFNVFKSSFLRGTAYHLIESSLYVNGVKERPSGRCIWTNFLTWRNSGGRKDTQTKRL